MTDQEELPARAERCSRYEVCVLWALHEGPCLDEFDRPLVGGSLLDREDYS